MNADTPVPDKACNPVLFHYEIRQKMTVKEYLQKETEAARQALQDALTRQSKAEILGINDWNHTDLTTLLHGNPF